MILERMAKRKREQMAPMTASWPLGASPRFLNFWFTTKVYIRRSSHTSENICTPSCFLGGFMPQA